MAAILNFMFYKTSTRMRAPHPPRYHHRGTSQAKTSRAKKKLLAKTMLAAVSLQYPAVFAHICINIDFTIFFFLKTNERIGFLIPENIRIDIYFSSVCSCKIIRKYVYFYIPWRPSWISPF